MAGTEYQYDEDAEKHQHWARFAVPEITEYGTPSTECGTASVFQHFRTSTSVVP